MYFIKLVGKLKHQALISTKYNKIITCNLVNKTVFAETQFHMEFVTTVSLTSPNTFVFFNFMIVFF